MMKTFPHWLAAMVAICLAAVLTGGSNPPVKEALKVEHILKTIEQQPPQPNRKEQTAEVTEKELNAYIAYRLRQEKSPLINSLKVALLDQNHVQGAMGMDAERLNLSLLVGPNLDFDFQGIAHSKEGAARLELARITLQGQPLEPQMLDLILNAVSAYSGEKIGRPDDWYQMPKGIKRFTVQQSKMILYY
jgi:hypothetical protein